jgi:hypothetical protein
MKNIMESFHNRLEQAKVRISEIKDKSFELSPSDKTQQRKMKERKY